MSFLSNIKFQYNLKILQDLLSSDDLNNYKLDVSNYRSGVYFVTISTMNIRVSNKFIKL